MLSNCKLRQAWANVPSIPGYVYDFEGDSMTPPLTIEEFQHAILPGDEIWCEKENIAPRIENELIEIKPTDVFVIHPYFEKEFVARVVKVSKDLEMIKFGFLNPDKAIYPDIVMRTYEIISIHLVKSIHRWARGLRSGACLCGSDGDYCGPGCKQPENKPK